MTTTPITTSEPFDPSNLESFTVEMLDAVEMYERECRRTDSGFEAIEFVKDQFPNGTFSEAFLAWLRAS